MLLDFTQISWNLCLYKDLHTEDNRFIHNCQNLEVTKMSFIRRMDKLCYIQAMDYYSGLKRTDLSNHEKTWRKIICMLLSERSQSENYMTSWNLQKYGNNKKD